jgi:hypothetical protein
VSHGLKHIVKVTDYRKRYIKKKEGGRCIRQWNGHLNVFDLLVLTVIVMSIGEDGKFDVWVTVMLVHRNFIRDSGVFDVGIAGQPFVAVVDL